MKQNTRIARLARNRRFKKITNLATVVMLVCPLAIGAVKALADSEETLEATTEEVIQESAPIEEVTTNSEVAQEAVTEQSLEAPKIEPFNLEPQMSEATELEPETTNDILSAPAVRSNISIVIRCTDMTGQNIAPEKSMSVPINGTTVITAPEIEGYDLEATFPPTGDNYDDYDFVNSIVLNDYENRVFTIAPNGASFSGVIYLQFGYVETETEEEWQKPDMSKLRAIYNSIGDQSQYTPESWAAFTDHSDVTNYYIAETMLIVDSDEGFDNKYTQAEVDAVAATLQNAINTILVKKDVTPDPEEKVNVTINYVSSENGTINTLTQEAVKGKPLTVTAPDTFTQSTGPSFFRTSDASQTIASASEGAVITFNYDRIVGILNEIYVDGPTSATVGDSVTYREKSVSYFNYGDPRIDYLDITAERPITISDPSAAEITAGTVKFLKAGTYTLTIGNNILGETFTVTVSEAGTVTPDPDPTVENTEWFVTGNLTAKPGDVNTIGIDERVTYSDGSIVDTPNITIPMLYVLRSTDPSDVITGNTIKYGNEGERTVTFTTMGRAGGFSITGLTVKVSNDAVTPPTNPVEPDPGKPILPKPVEPVTPKPGTGGSATGTVNNATLVKNNLDNTKTSSKLESDKNLPQTGEKETYIMFLSGIVALGGMLATTVFKRKRKEI